MHFEREILQISQCIGFKCYLYESMKNLKKACCYIHKKIQVIMNQKGLNA